MPVPKQRHTKGRRNKRRSHHALKKLQLVACSKCGQMILPHQACFNCGTYNNREIIDVLKKLSKKERKQKEKEIKAAEVAKTKENPLTMEELSKKV